MPRYISKSDFVLKASELLHQVESSGEEMVITDRGRAVIKIVPFVERALQEALDDLRGSVVFYKSPTAPVGLQDWKDLGFPAKPHSGSPDSDFN